MKCQVCNRDFGTALSICPACGAMMNDTVRTELATKVTPSGNLRPSPSIVLPSPMPERNPYKVPPPATKVAPPKPPARTATAQLRAPKTSQTLVDFQAKNAPIPEWRLQMQNAVRSRRGGAATASAPVVPVLMTNGSAALKAEVEVPQIAENADPRLGLALKRIAEARDCFTPSILEKEERQKQSPQKIFPFDVVTSNGKASVRPPSPVANPLPKPKLVAPNKEDKSQLPKYEGAIAVVPDDKEIKRNAEPMIIKSTGDLEPAKRIFIAAEKNAEEYFEPEIEDDEIEDLAPVGMRFNSGLFDLIICMVVTMLLLSPFAFSNREWFSPSSLAVFAGLFALTTFLYSTIGVGVYGRTMGMKIFGLEIVDAEENEYPTLAQAAVHSALYIGSLALAGAGFIVMLFNEERRAIHDLMSGTIVVRQF